MRNDPLPSAQSEEAPDAKALLRLLSYAFIEANQLGLEDCALLINQAASEVQFRLEIDDDIGPAADLQNLH